MVRRYEYQPLNHSSQDENEICALQARQYTKKSWLKYFFLVLFIASLALNAITLSTSFLPTTSKSTSPQTLYGI